jgi:hypothetical protein
MSRSRVSTASVLLLLAAVILQGCGNSFDPLREDDWAEVHVVITSANSSLIPGQRNTVLIRVPNAGKSVGPDVVLQFPPPIGFRYDSVTCRSSGVITCPTVSVQQLAGGVMIPTFPPGSELAFTFEGVTTGDVGTQVAITGYARSDYTYWDKDLSNNSALLYIPIVAPTASPGG